MTAQVSEILLHRGMKLAMAEVPLNAYLARLRKSKRPDMVWCSTACWRRYVGTWEIRDGYLCLVGLETVLQIDGREVVADLDMALPWARGCLRATWLTGALRCVEGRLQQYVHHGFQSTYEFDRWFHIYKGRLEQEIVTVNPPPPLLYRIDADGRRQCIDGVRDPTGIPDPLDGRPLTDAYMVWGQKPETVPDDEQGYRVMAELTRI